jgi:hypothetical protein
MEDTYIKCKAMNMYWLYWIVHKYAHLVILEQITHYRKEAW